jgi:hypothetical protein
MVWIDSKEYLRRNPDVAKAGVDPLWHVLSHVLDGPKEPRSLLIEGTAPPQSQLPAGFDPVAYLAYHFCGGRNNDFGRVCKVAL